MPFLAALAGVLVNVVGSVVGRALLALGMGYVTFKGINTSTDWLLDQIKTNLGMLDGRILRFIAFMWVDRAISMIFSAYAAASVIRMAGSSSLTKLVVKGPAP